LGIPSVTVDFVSSDQLGQTTITAMYLADQRILFISDWLMEAKPDEVLLAAFHEVRHAYQKSQIDAMRYGVYTEPSNLIQRWKIEFDAYHRTNDSKSIDLQYLEQGIEIDARKFANKTLQRFYSTEEAT
jgi:hypothetical protein